MLQVKGEVEVSRGIRVRDMRRRNRGSIEFQYLLQSSLGARHPRCTFNSSSLPLLVSLSPPYAHPSIDCLSPRPHSRPHISNSQELPQLSLEHSVSYELSPLRNLSGHFSNVSFVWLLVVIDDEGVETGGAAILMRIWTMELAGWWCARGGS